jgi:hypothetical protein
MLALLMLVEFLVTVVDNAGLNEIPLFQLSSISRLSQLTFGHIWVGFRKYSYVFVLSLQSTR